MPRAGRACFLIAFINTAVWGFVVPPFQVPDEISHFGYAQYLAESGKPPPGGSRTPYSQQERAALHSLNFFSVLGHPEQRVILTAREDRELRNAIAHTNPVGPGGATQATNQPPLYYAVEAIPYLISPSGDILFRLTLMRLLSALMAAGTVLATFLFLRELLPRSRWAWTVGALAVAFQPMFDFIAAGVHADNLLFLTSAVTFLLLARAYRRGLTIRRGALIGTIVAAGMLTKLTYFALLPGIVLTMLLLGARSKRRGATPPLRALAVAVTLAALPLIAYALLNVTLWHRAGPTAGGLGGVSATQLSGVAVTFSHTLEYIWQLYLPRPPFMRHAYFREYPLLAVWINGSIGEFGWLDYRFPGWAYSGAHYVLFAMVGLAGLAIVRLRHMLRPMLPLFACFAVVAAGLLVVIGDAGIHFRADTGHRFEQARYLFPLLVFWALFVILAARGAGRRWAPVLGAALVVLAMAHSLFAELLTISRYYG